MKLTISSIELAKMVKAVFSRAPNKKAKVTLTAAEGRFILRSAAGGTMNGAIITAAGEVVVPAQAFCGVVESFRGTDFIEISAGSDGLRLNSFKMPVVSWNPSPVMPEEFQ